ncbi:hypothetical protein BKA63DRAFT_486964 [Paraphoma chrysanthemicola]|nr:hypothetical protein BKA63DRAFT_486964 [Paraphoma chrysanthemicola]
MVLQAHSNIPITEERIQHFENHRVDFVPQYLFRAWSAKSGDGYPTTINSETEIIPAAFVHGRKVPDFYIRSEAELYSIVYNHCGGRFFPSEFSSWSASLHLVLVYASSMPLADDPHVAVMDTHQVERDSGVLRGLGRTISRFPPGFELKPWLQDGGVDTRGGFHDVKQWIQLLRILATYQFPEVLEGRKRKRTVGEDSVKHGGSSQPERKKRLS